MKLPVYQVDAFPARVFAGNPGGGFLTSHLDMTTLKAAA
jgi:predicted PhzF superfamily epimerase YddE/YHI9